MRVQRFAMFTLVVFGIVVLSGAPVAASAPVAPAQRSKTIPPPASTGNDVSWPQCMRLNSLPSNQAFGIIGVNNGTPNTTNPCFASELAWAEKSSGTTHQPKATLYVNTANPGDTTPTVADWPTSNFNITEPNVVAIDPYGTCNGADDTACSWQYGYNLASLDATTRDVPTPSSYQWYLDVETVNSWTASPTRNAADLEGMVTYFKNAGIAVGLYSTYRQWGDIVGSNYGESRDAGGDVLNGLPSWVPGASDESSAEADCGLRPFTEGGRVVLSQYLSVQADLDFDVACS